MKIGRDDLGKQIARELRSGNKKKVTHYSNEAPPICGLPRKKWSGDWHSDNKDEVDCKKCLTKLTNTGTGG